MSNPFFKNFGPFKIEEILNALKISFTPDITDTNIYDIKDLQNATRKDLTFFHSKKYKDLANQTNASFCITTNNLKNELPLNCIPLIVDNVLVSTSVVTTKFYPGSLNDNFDKTAIDIKETKYKKTVQFGKNVLIGENVSFGNDCSIGHNSIIEKNVLIGNNCSIGSNTILRNSLVGNNVKILDNCIIGKHGFGFFPNNKYNLRYPHIGVVYIEDNCEIGCGATIDRGSMSNTVIGKNSLLDNWTLKLDNISSKLIFNSS